jgi:MFS family permease
VQLPANWRDLAFIMATSSLVGAMHSLSFPLLSLVLERAGMAPWLIGLNAAAMGLGIFGIAPWMGGLVQRVGAVRCMQIGLALAALCLLALPLHVSFTAWFALRFLLGLGAAMVFVVSEAAVNGLAEDRLRGRILGVYATLFCVGYAAGPLVVAAVGSEGYLPFLIGGALLLLGLVPASLAHAADGALRAPGGHRPRLLLIWRLAPLTLAGALVFSILESAHFAILPVFALAVGMTEAAAALLLSVWIAGNIVLQIPLGWLADRVDRRAVLQGATAVSLAGVLLLPPAAGTALVWPLMLVLGGTMGGLYTLTLVLLGQQFKGGDLPIANTAFVVTMHIGLMLGPALGGLGMSAAGAPGLPVSLALVLAALLAAHRLAARR